MPRTIATHATCVTCGREVGRRSYTDGFGETYCKECYELEYVTCACCEKEFLLPSETLTTPDGKPYCMDCWDEHYTECSECGEVINFSDAKEAYLGNYYCEWCFDDCFFRCPDCGDLIDSRDGMASPDGDYLCECCWSNSCGTCDSCGETFWLDDLVCDGYDSYCRNCRPYMDNFRPGNFRNTGNKSKVVGSRRRYGLELETNKCDGYGILEGSSWGAKDDCTVSGKEFYSTILWGDKGLESIASLATLARKKRWEVANNCGYHLHIDMTHEDSNSLFAIAYAYRKTQEIWCSFVDECRSDDSYCHRCDWTINDLTSHSNFRDFVDNVYTRYNWFNVYAYHDHRTFEIRLHEGTCDKDKICNWIKAHLRFTDWAASKGYKGVQDAFEGKTNEEMFEIIVSKAWKDDELADYYRDMAETLEHGFLAAA